MSLERYELGRFPPVLIVTNLLSLLSSQQRIGSNFKILKIFEPSCWLLFIILLLICSLININSEWNTKNLILKFIISILNHIEPLLTKRSKFMK